MVKTRKGPAEEEEKDGNASEHYSGVWGIW